MIREKETRAEKLKLGDKSIFLNMSVSIKDLINIINLILKKSIFVFFMCAISLLDGYSLNFGIYLIWFNNEIGNSMKTIISHIIGDLKKYSDPVYQKSVQRFFLEPIKCYGVRKDTVKKIAKLFWLEIKDGSKSEIFDLCDQLLDIGYMETSIVAFQWSLLLKKRYELSDIKVFESWLSKYVTNWALCDDLCGGALGVLLKHYPELIDTTESWLYSKNRWMRRASVVCLIYAGLTRDQLPIIFNRCTILLTAEDPMIQKGYGWLLKKTADRYQKEVFDFVMQHKNTMPRTALRYAIEKMPVSFKNEAMR